MLIDQSVARLQGSSAETLVIQEGRGIEVLEAARGGYRPAEVVAADVEDADPTQLRYLRRDLPVDLVVVQLQSVEPQRESHGRQIELKLVVRHDERVERLLLSVDHE